MKPLLRVDHIQLAIPADGDERARAFYCGVLGLQEVQRPPEMAGTGGGWFASGDVAVHLGVDEPFRPATKAHPAFVCTDYETLLATLRGRDVPITPAPPSPEGKARCHISDPFGNRIELIAS